MKTNILHVIFAAAIAMLAIGCSVDEQGKENNPYVVCPITDQSRAVFNGSRDMTFPFFNEVNNTVKADENFMISPLSLTEVLAMLANGAEGETQKQILQVMNIGQFTHDKASESLSTLNMFLTTADKKSTVAIANSQWVDDDITVKDAYINDNESWLNAETYNQNLSTLKTLDDINSWCDRKTNGCIPKIFNEPLSDDTKLVLINALYFRGLWKEKFNKDNTRDEDFTNYDGTKTKVKMMHLTKEFPACVDDNMDMAEFSYGNGTFCMDVILPHEGVSLDECLKELNNEKMDELLHAMDRSYVTLSMPRMELKYRRSLNEDLKKMGMENVFNPMLADFSSISDSRLFVSFVEQATSLKVDEEGTTAVAVTVAGGDLAAGPPPSQLTFTMNRPFAFLIRERQTGVVLFIGRMVKF